MANHLRFLIVRLEGREFAIPQSRVLGMLQMRGADLTAVESRGPLRYLIQLQGRTLPVFAPHRAMGLKDRGISARSCLLLISGHMEDDHTVEYVLIVDSVSRHEDLPPNLFREPGLVRLGDKWREVLDVDRLCAA